MDFCQERQQHRYGMARHGGGGHGRGGFFGRRGRGDSDGFRMGRRLGSGDLQLLILLLLQENPRHGYELIKELEQRTSGYYSPSPGVIYPALTYLDEIGFASVEADGNKKQYRISETGAAFLAENRSSADAMLGELVEIGRRFARARQTMSEEDGAPESEEEIRPRHLAARRAAFRPSRSRTRAGDRRGAAGAPRLEACAAGGDHRIAGRAQADRRHPAPRRRRDPRPQGVTPGTTALAEYGSNGDQETSCSPRGCATPARSR